MPRRSHSRYSSSSSSSDGASPILVTQTIGGSHNRHHARAQRRGEFLAAPAVGGRHRASSTGATPAPQVIMNVGGSRSRSRSRERRRPSRRRGDSSSSEEEVVVRREHHRGRLTAHSSSPRPGDRGYDYHMQRRLEKLEALELEERDRELEKELKREIKAKAAQKKVEELEAKEKEEKLRKQYVQDWKKDEAEKKIKEKEKQEEEDRKYEERVRRDFGGLYSESHIQSVLDQRKRKRRENILALDLKRPTWIKVHRHHLVPQTLQAYGLDWEFDPEDSSYIIIKQYISQDLQERLFEHTKSLKNQKLITSGVEETKVIVAGKKDRMYLVREKGDRSKSRDRRRSFIFT